MATIILKQSFDFRTSQDWAWEMNDYNASFISITDGVHTQTLSGSFTYDYNGIHGIVTGSSFYLNGIEVYSASGMSVDANILQDYLETWGDTQETYAYVLRGDDSITGSGGNDGILGCAGNDIINGREGNDYMEGGTGNDTLEGGTGNDILYGGAGNDHMEGGTGDDIYIVDSGGDVVVESSGAGTDTVYASVDYTLGADIEKLYLTGTAEKGTGNALDNLVIGNGIANILSGLGGADKMYGYDGDDTYVVESTGDIVVEEVDFGTDTVHASLSYSLGANVENLSLFGTAIKGTGNTLDNIINGNSSNNILSGLAGNDTLDGDTGNDSMTGGTGNDTYFVDSVGDIVVEAAGEGTDEVHASISYTLRANVEDLYLSGIGMDTVGTGNALDNIIVDDNYEGNNVILYGNGGNDKLFGASGNDYLDGGTGNDTMSGGNGDDGYVVDSMGDDVIEGELEGSDSVYASISYTLGDNVESLDLSEGTATTGTGNDLDNAISGNSNANTLNGLAGDDHLYGYGGNDTLDGGTGYDYLYGGDGDDKLTAGGYGGELYGEAGNDTLSGGIGEYYLYGGDGDDKLTNGDGGGELYGGAGNDILIGGASEEHLWGGDGNDTLIAGNGDTTYNYLYGADGDDTLIGGAGDDYLDGGDGNDTYVVSGDSDTINEGGGTDTVQSSVTYILNDDLENLTLTGTAAIIGFGNTLDNIILGNNNANDLYGEDGSDTLRGNGGNDTLDGGAGNDSMYGGTGDDIYYVDSAGDVVYEAAGAGIDSVYADVSYTLGSNVESLYLYGTATNGIGNALENLIVGNDNANTLSGGDGSDILHGYAGNDSLNGGAGADKLYGEDGNDSLYGGAGNDSMYGGIGDDLYNVDSAGDVINEGVGSGTDRVNAYVSYALSSNVENLYLYGTATTGTGNALDNLIVGNDNANTLSGGDGSDILHGYAGNDSLNGGAGADKLYGQDGNDSLYGGAGNDSMYGGTGDDTYNVDSAGDVINEGVGSGTDRANAYVSYALGSNVESLYLYGTATAGTGNALDNLIVGNDNANTLSGGDGSDILHGYAGNDSLNGGAGADKLYGQDGNDTLNGGVGNDILNGGSGMDYFDFTTALNASTNKDIINDFSAVDDTIRLENSIMTGLGVTTGVLAAAAFHSGTINIATETDDRIVYNTSTGALFYDADGTGATEAVQIAVIGGTIHPALTNADFMVI